MVFGPIPDREYHEGFMRKAIEMAQLALRSDETPVGCVFVKDGEVIGRGINGTNASLNVSIGRFYPSLPFFPSLPNHEECPH
jgi:tRNA-specific adenosine deaminase 2